MCTCMGGQELALLSVVIHVFVRSKRDGTSSIPSLTVKKNYRLSTRDQAPPGKIKNDPEHYPEDHRHSEGNLIKRNSDNSKPQLNSTVNSTVLFVPRDSN